MSRIPKPGVTVFCVRHNRTVYRKGNRILHDHPGSNADPTCDSQQFEVNDVRVMGRDDAARVLIVVEVADKAAQLAQQRQKSGNSPV
jgi:hypothetical protein